MAGLPGTGKSAIARVLAERLHVPLLDKDRVRDALFAPHFVEYSREQDDAVCALVYGAVELLARKRSCAGVVLDGRTYSRADQVDALRGCAARAGARLDVIACMCSDEIARERLERDRELGAHPARDRDFALYMKLKAQAQPLGFAHLKLATDSQSPEELAAAAVAWIRSRDCAPPFTSSRRS
jgi:adenylylsulfate kinase